MNETDAKKWLEEKNWIVTEARVEALVAGIDLERDCGGCTSWSDGGPCGTCVGDALDAYENQEAN